MTDDSSDPDSPESFSSSSSFDEGADFDERSSAPPWGAEGDTSDPEDLSASFTVDMARLWVQRHQKASMLGAFAVGVFVGALLRE